MVVIRMLIFIAALAFTVIPANSMDAGKKASTPPDAVFTQRLNNLYGAPVPLAVAKAITTAAINEAKKHGWQIAAAVVDPGGNLIYYERMDGTHNAGATIAIEKARASAAFKRSSKLLEDRVVAGRLQYLRLPFAMPIEGGLPLLVHEKIIGAIGISGAHSEQDGVVVKAAVEALPQAVAQFMK